MRIGAAPGRPPEASQLAEALRNAAGQLGHRPAVTVLYPDHREEQGYASLAQWASKGAHLLQIEHLLGPGDRVAVVGPVGWLPAAVCLAAWWAGITVTLEGPAGFAVVHEGGTPPDDMEVASWGDAVDGSPLGESAYEPFAIAVQAFPDQPPSPRATPDAVALEAAGRSWTQAQLLAAATTWGDEGALGVDVASAPPDEALIAAAVRPLVTGRPTVLLRGASRDAAVPEGVDRWLG